MKQTCNEEYWKIGIKSDSNPPCGREFDDYHQSTQCPHNPLPDKLTDAQLDSLWEMIKTEDATPDQSKMEVGNPYRYLPKATRDIKKGEIIEASDLEWPPEVKGGFWRKITKEEEEADKW